jgi:hypothetical protein
MTAILCIARNCLDALTHTFCSFLWSIMKIPQVTCTTPNKCIWKLPTSTQLHATWHTDSLYMVALPFTGALRYHNCCIMATTVWNILDTTSYTRVIQKISSVGKYCRCSAVVTMVRMRAELFDSLSSHGCNMQTFEQCLRIVLCVCNV